MLVARAAAVPCWSSIQRRVNEQPLYTKAKRWINGLGMLCVDGDDDDDDDDDDDKIAGTADIS